MDLLLDVLLLPKCKIDEALRLCHDVELLNKIQNVSQEVTESWDAGIPLYAKEALNEARQAKIELLSLMLDEYNARMHKDVLERMQLAEGSLAAYDMLKDPGFIGKRYPRSKRKLSDKDIKELDELFHAQNRSARGKEYDERQARIDELLGFIKPGKVKKAAAAAPATASSYDEPFLFVVDLDERGYFKAHVEDVDGKPIFSCDNGNMRVIKLPAKAEAAMSNVNKIKRSLQDCRKLEEEMIIRFENGMLTKSQFERAMADIEKKREPLFKQLAEEQAEAAVLAVRLDGHGRNFSKQEIKEMREELVEMGAYNNAEVDDMDDEDVLGYWQAEIGYIEMDDAACSYAETDDAGCAYAAGAPDEFGLRWAEWGRSGSKVWKEKWFKKETDREKFFDKISEKDNFAEFGAYTDPESSADCTYAEIAAASEDIKTKVIILWRKGRSIRQIESELGVIIQVPGSISDMNKNVLSGNFDVHAESDLSYELKELEADEETGAAECGVYANNRIVAVLTQRVNDKGQKEWALVSHSKGKDGKRKVLKWFGKGKPSDKAVKKEEDRVQMFKHMR